MSAPAITAQPADGFVVPENPRLKMFSTLVILAGSLLTALSIPLDASELEMYRFCAYSVLATLILAFGIEGIAGIRSLIRVDVVALATLYFLTFAEFLHPNVRVLFAGVTGGAVFACQLVLIGLCGIAVGRHINLFRQAGGHVRQSRGSLPEVSPKAIITIFFLFAFLGYFYVLLTTSFNPIDIAAELLKPRFARPWQRGKEGGWLSFLTELQLLNYLVAALGGYIYANARDFALPKRIGVTAILLFMLFFDSAEGARNVVLIKAGLFTVTFFISSRKTQSLRILMISFVAIASLWAISGYMLDFRNVGLGEYVAGGAANSEQDESFMIDNNVVTIARVVQIFPSSYPYPGTDVLAQVFTKWIPRALWPGKPTNWSNSIESALGVGGGTTLAVTYVGEAYLVAGVPSLIFISLLIGAFSSAWTRVGVAARSNLDLIYYASGFFAATLGMRSIQFITVAMLPTVAFFIFGRYLASRAARQRFVPHR